MKTRVLATLLIFMLLTLSGCWNKDEPKELASINSILYDRTDNGKYRLMAEILKPLSSNGSEDANKIEKASLGPVTGEGDSIREAIVSLSRSVEKRTFGGHNKVRFLTERFVRAGMLPLLEVSSRDMLMDETPFIIVVKSDTPEEIFSSALGLSDMLGDYFENLARLHTRRVSNAVCATNLDFIKEYYLEGKQPVVGMAELTDKRNQPSENVDGGSSRDSSGSGGKEEQKCMMFEGLAAFKDDKLVGFMNAVETRAYNLVAKSVNAALISLSEGDKQTVVRISHSKSDIKTSIENGQVLIRVGIKAKLDVVEEDGQLDVSMPEALKSVEDRFNGLMRDQVAAAISKAQTEFESDIFGFGRKVHIQHPDKWPELKENWDTHFSEASVQVAVESSVIRSGQIKKPMGG